MEDHNDNTIPRSGAEAREQGRVDEYAAHIKRRLIATGQSEAQAEAARIGIIARFGTE